MSTIATISPVNGSIAMSLPRRIRVGDPRSSSSTAIRWISRSIDNRSSRPRCGATYPLFHPQRTRVRVSYELQPPGRRADRLVQETLRTQHTSMIDVHKPDQRNGKLGRVLAPSQFKVYARHAKTPDHLGSPVLDHTAHRDVSDQRSIRNSCSIRPAGSFIALTLASAPVCEPILPLRSSPPEPRPPLILSDPRQDTLGDISIG